MDTFLIFVILLIVVFLFIKINSIQNALSDVDEKLVSQKDIDTILRAIKDIANKPQSTQASEEVVSEPEVVPSITATRAEIVDNVDNVVIPPAKPVEDFFFYREEPTIPATINTIDTENGEIDEQPETLVTAAFDQVIDTPQITNTPQSESKRSWIEQFFSENLLTKIGVVTLVLGIAFFVKYAIDQEWINEIGRVGIGLFTGAIIIAIAHKLKGEYQVFSSLLVGGGISVFYITITLAFREYEIFSQAVAFALLIAVTVFSVILSLYYDRKELAIFSLLGGFASPLMISNGDGNYMVLFSYILMLNSGMLILAFRKQWRILSILSYVLTQLFFWGWLLRSFDQQYLSVTFFAVLFFVQFYILALVDHFKGGKDLTAYQAVLILTNNLSLFFACMTIFKSYQYNVKGLIPISIAAVNAVIMVALFRKSSINRNLIYLMIGLVLVFVNLAIPIQMNGYVITLFWAVEMSVLLWLWQKSQISIFSTGFVAVAALVLVSYFMDVIRHYEITTMPFSIVLNPVFITGVVVIAGFFVSKLLLDKDTPQSVITIGKIELCSVSTCSKLIGLALIGFTYIVPYLEINYQLACRIDLDEQTVSLRFMVLTAYTALYVAILSFANRKKIEQQALLFGLLSLFTIIYTMVYWQIVTEFRTDIYLLSNYTKTYFLLHFAAIIPLALVILTLIRNIKLAAPEYLKPFYWGMTIVATFLLSVEMDNISVMFFADNTNYADVLYDVYTFGFPVLWGLIAMGLMVWGLKGKELILRQISLIFFALIIVKFYIYDVWHMSQAGRIVSFILLGIIILLASFLQQKIKVLVSRDE